MEGYSCNAVILVSVSFHSLFSDVSRLISKVTVKTNASFFTFADPMLPHLFFLLSTLPASSASSLLIHTIDIVSPSEKTVIVSETESVPTESATVPPSDSAPSEVSEVVGVMDQGTPSQSKA